MRINFFKVNTTNENFTSSKSIELDDDDDKKLPLLSSRYLESKLNQSDSNLTYVLNENSTLKQRLQSYEHNEQTIRDLMTRFANNSSHDELFKTINRTLAIYEQRLGYINKRFLVLQTLFNRQLSKIPSKEQTTVAIQTEDEQYFDLTLLERELENVSRERDILLQRFDQDFDLSRKQSEQMEEKYRQEIRVANEKLSLMQLIVEENQSKVELYERNLLDKDRELKELHAKFAVEQEKRTENFDSCKSEFQVRNLSVLPLWQSIRFRNAKKNCWTNVTIWKNNWTKRNANKRN